jgi:hypothetical protein
MFAGLVEINESILIEWVQWAYSISSLFNHIAKVCLVSEAQQNEHHLIIKRHLKETTEYIAYA